MTCGRTGLPVNVTLLCQSGLRFLRTRNPVAIAVTRGARNLLARPMTLFCSCKMVGTPHKLAARSGGTVGYPPKPTTTLGLTRRTNDQALAVPTASNVAVRINDSGSRPRTVALGTTCTVARRKFEMRRTMVGGEVYSYVSLVKRVRECFCRKEMASGAAGREQIRAAHRSYPSDPAPGHRQLWRSHRRARLLASQRQQHSHCIGNRQHRRPAVGYERQCHAFGRHQMQVDCHVNRRLRGKQNGQAGGGKTRERIVIAHRTDKHANDNESKQRHQSEAQHHPEFLGRNCEHKVRMTLR